MPSDCSRANGVFNRLCDPESKLDISRWLETRWRRQVPTDWSPISSRCAPWTRSRTRRGLAVLARRAAAPADDQDCHRLLRPDDTIRAEGRTRDRTTTCVGTGCPRTAVSSAGDAGCGADGRGLADYHEVYEGNAAETQTLVPTIERVLEQFPIRRVVLVADRGLLSIDNLEAIGKIRVGDRPLEFILAVPARRYSDFDELLEGFHNDTCLQAEASEGDKAIDVTGEFAWQGHRLSWRIGRRWRVS